MPLAPAPDRTPTPTPPTEPDRGLTRRWRPRGEGETTGGTLVDRVLRSRGLTDPIAAQAFLDPSLRDLHDPGLLPGVDAAAARLLEILALESGDADSVFARLKTGMTTPELLIPASEQTKFALVEKLVARQGDFADGNVSTLDGLRVDFEDGWGLVRASNTTPALTARFEGRDKAALQRIVALFRKTLQDIEPKLKLPF